MEIDKNIINKIKNELIKSYTKTRGGENNHRELLIWKPKKETDGGNCYFFALSGTPPKGYALYIPDLRKLTLYDVTGKIIKTYNEFIISKN